MVAAVKFLLRFWQQLFPLPDSAGAVPYDSVTSPALCVPGEETESPLQSL